MAKNKSRINIKVLIGGIIVIAVIGIASILYNNSQKKPVAYKNFVGMNKTLLSVTPNPTYTLNPNESINSAYVFPSFAEIVSPELDPILKLKPGITTKKDIQAILGDKLYKDYRGEYGQTIKVQGKDDELTSAFINYYFSENEILLKIHYYNEDFSGTTIKDIEDIMGTPNMIYDKSPSERNVIEYAYPTKGITFIFDEELKAFTMFPPKTFKQYVEEYEDMLPYDQHL